MAKFKRILVFGDSIANGGGDREGGWAKKLSKYLYGKIPTEPDFYYSIYNLSISGTTTSDLLKRVEFETKQRLGKQKKEMILIYAIGLNDSMFIHSKNSLETKPEKFTKNLQKLINLGRNLSSKIIFIGLTPVNQPKTTPIYLSSDISFKNEYVKQYNEIMKTVCKENKVFFIDSFEQLNKPAFIKLLKDGWHPNSQGHQKIFEIVKKYLITNKIILNDPKGVREKKT